ncbi:MAG: hypothetical protein HYZ14_06300 [Bacteroidetes bacterium]|nr:hypothetical protein [Bacteroidota bacterium]
MYHDDGSLKKDVDEEIEYIDWYPNGLVKRIYRTATSTLSDLYFEYDPTGNRTLKVEMTRTGTTLNAAEDWLYTYYGADANGITMAVYDYNPDDTDPDVLTKNETMLYGGSRLGMETTAEIVNTAVDYLADCNNDGLASGVIQLGAFTPTTGVVVEILLDGDLLADITWNTANSIEVHGEALVAEINADALGYYAEMIDMGSYVYIRLKEIIAGSLLEKDFTVELDNTSTPSYIKRQPGIGDCYADRKLGKKFFELTNYLGNVMEVIADRKVAHNNAGTIDYFEADVISYADYYPFGQDMPGRGGSMANYRYGYNGMEKDPEVSGNGNSYTTQFRQYDPRLGRWKSLDPLMALFPNVSAFNGFGNNPIFYVDPLGLSEGKPDKPARGQDRREWREAKRSARQYARQHDIDSYELKRSSTTTGSWWIEYGGMATEVITAKVYTPEQKVNKPAKPSSGNSGSEVSPFNLIWSALGALNAKMKELGSGKDPLVGSSDGNFWFIEFGNGSHVDFEGTLYTKDEDDNAGLGGGGSEIKSNFKGEEPIYTDGGYMPGSIAITIGKGNELRGFKTIKVTKNGQTKVYKSWNQKDIDDLDDLFDTDGAEIFYKMVQSFTHGMLIYDEANKLINDDSGGGNGSQKPVITPTGDSTWVELNGVWYLVDSDSSRASGGWGWPTPTNSRMVPNR